MLVNRPTENQDIVQVHCNKSPDIVREDLVHQPLKAGRCIAQPKRHDEEFKLAAVSTKSCLLN